MSPDEMDDCSEDIDEFDEYDVKRHIPQGISN
jgi:hypothetical protein